jgi:hypothetical protein
LNSPIYKIPVLLIPAVISATFLFLIQNLNSQTDCNYWLAHRFNLLERSLSIFPSEQFSLQNHELFLHALAQIWTFMHFYVTSTIPGSAIFPARWIVD